jgi:hypothetical protein
VRLAPNLRGKSDVVADPVDDIVETATQNLLATLRVNPLTVDAGMRDGPNSTLMAATLV